MASSSSSFCVGVACVAGVVAGGLAGCPGEALRAVTYPPSFQYVTKERLHGAMGQLAEHVQSLDDVLRAEGTPDDERRARAAALLDEMKAIAARVSAPGQSTNHPMLDRNAGRFQLDLALARSALDRAPVDFAPAGRITDACLSCHVGTGGGPVRRGG
jgi:hypothetical protein